MENIPANSYFGRFMINEKKRRTATRRSCPPKTVRDHGDFPDTWRRDPYIVQFNPSMEIYVYKLKLRLIYSDSSAIVQIQNSSG